MSRVSRAVFLLSAAFVIASVIALAPVRAEGANVAVWGELSPYTGAAGVNVNLNVNGNIIFPDSADALEIKAANLTIQGDTPGALTSFQMKNGISGLAPSVTLLEKYTEYENTNGLYDLIGKVEQQASTLVSGYIISANAAVGGMRQILGSGSTRESQIDIPGNTQNSRKWLDGSSTAMTSYGNGLKLTNLSFRNAKVKYGGVPSNPALYGVVNGLIGNNNVASATTSLGDITGNAFTDLDVKMIGYYDTQYLAGGGIIGVRATGEALPAGEPAEALMGTVSNNYFNNVKVYATDTTENPYSSAQLGSAYIEGGGLIGVDAVSTPAKKQGRAKIEGLHNNLFTNIEIGTGDIIIGGGLVGLNNNSKIEDNATLISQNTSAQLISATGNVFAGNIKVSARFSIRGGGVIGLNGLSTAGALLGELNSNIFSGIKVESRESYLRGGGIVGLQTNYIDTDKNDKDRFPVLNDPNPDSGYFSTIFGSTWTELNNASGNLFLDSTVSTGTYLQGGGIVGLHSSEAQAVLWKLNDNLFRSLDVQVGTHLPLNGDLKGGGIVGVSSKGTALIDTIRGNYFDDISINVKGKLSGGGIIGAQSDGNVGNLGVSGADNIIHNNFTRSTVTAGTIEGGGVFGAQSGGIYAGAAGIEGVDYSGISGNRVYDVSVETTDSYISGGGIFGVHTKSTDAASVMYNVNHNMLSSVDVKAATYIEGGGLVGVSANYTGLIKNMVGDFYLDADVTAGTYIDGGGIVGATSGFAAWDADDPMKEIGISKIKNNVFYGNKIQAKNGTIAGGLVYSYGTPQDGMTIEDSYFMDNTAVSEVTGNGVYKDANPTAKVYGTVTIDTGREISNDKNIAKLTLSATSPSSTSSGLTVFSGNIISDDNGQRFNSIYIGTVDGMSPDIDGRTVVTPDNADANALLVVKTWEGGEIHLYDPIVVSQDHDKSFDMEVVPGDNGKRGIFYWDGYPDANVFETNGTKGTITLKPNTYTVLLPGMILDAPDHTFKLEPGGTLAVSGSGSRDIGTRYVGRPNNKMTVDKAVLQGTLEFRLSGTDINDSTNPLLSINTSNSNEENYVTLSGSTVLLTPFAETRELEPGERFYLIVTQNDKGIETNPNNDTAWAYARGSSTKGYNFIIDNSVPKDLTDPLSTTADDSTETLNTNRKYLVARLPHDTLLPDTPVEPVGPPDEPVLPYPDPLKPPTPPTPSITPGPTTPVDNPPKPYDPPDNPYNPTPPVTPTPDPEPQPQPQPQPQPDPDPDPDPIIPAHETRAITNGRLAGLAFVGARGAWLPDHSYESAEIALSGDILSDDVLGRSRAAFGGIDGAWLRVHNDNSHVDLNGTNIMLGYASKERKDGGKDEQGEDKPDSTLLWAAFLDIGHGNYDTYDNFDFVTTAQIPDIHGDGTLRSYGIGVMARKQWENGFRIEGSLRGGKLKNEFTASNYEVGDGVPVSYTTDAPYYGLHLGVGKTFLINDNPRDRLDLLLRYYWNRQDGDTATLPDGDVIDFGRDDSHRFRIGARYTRAHDYRRSWYIGAALEHEFSGGIHARTSRFILPAYDMEGTTGIGEIGIIIRPDRDTAKSDDKNFSLETGIQGYTGKYSGISAGLRFEWEF
jgi:hypothetical protein